MLPPGCAPARVSDRISHIARLARRHTSVDCERPTTDEDILDARRSALMSLSAGLEYQVHGLFKKSEEGRPWPDSYYFSVPEMHDAGVPKYRIAAALSAYESSLSAAAHDVMSNVPEDEGEHVGEDEGEDEGAVEGAVEADPVLVQVAVAPADA